MPGDGRIPAAIIIGALFATAVLVAMLWERAKAKTPRADVTAPLPKSRRNRLKDLS
jgi:hypothetical protein